MSEPVRISNSTSLNQLNIGLMLASCLVAFVMPFQLFLFAYAILGPAHYLTEISWLHKRHFFTKGRYDFWLLAGLAAVAVAVFQFSGVGFNGVGGLELAQTTSMITFLAFGSALVFMLTEKTWHRALGLAIVMMLSLLSLGMNLVIALTVELLGTTLVHVYVFTGFFIIYGALKERSRSGYLSFCIFLLCPLLFVLLQPQSALPSQYVVTTYWTQFSQLNQLLLGVGNVKTQADLTNAMRLVFKSDAGLVLMRFIAFAYTYHYLNWFSKTSLIRWHQIPRQRLAILGGIWLACVALYLYDYSVGFKVLTCLSLMHVYLEFPLNHISILGIFRELASGRVLKRATA